MTGIVPEYWSEWVVAVQEDQSPRPAKAGMLADDAISHQLQGIPIEVGQAGQLGPA